jgi:hypothetical protein
MSTSHRVKALFKVVTIALVMAVCSFAKSTHDQPRNSDAALLVSGNPPAAIKLKEEEIRQHDDWWSVDIKYPQAEGADVFNMAVRRNLTATIEDFRKGLPKSATTGYPDYGGYLKGTYAAQVLKSGVISVLLSYEEYAPGAAHPGGIMASVDYDARVQRVLALSDLFLPQSDYVSRLSALAIDSLDHHEYAVPDMIRRGAGPVESNFKVFTLTDDALVLHFQQYQVAAGAAPSEQVVIPLTALAPLLRKEYRPAR